MSFRSEETFSSRKPDSVTVSRLPSRSAPNRTGIRYSFVIPILDEEAALPFLLSELDQLLGTLDGRAEVIFVDDGSRDDGPGLVRSRADIDSRYRILELSRNFGHQAAITAGMDHTSGSAVIVMDADLQDPPLVVLQMIAKWQEGYDIVYARRTAREAEGWLKRATAWLFYRTLRRLTAVDVPADVGDFRLIDRSVLRSFQTMPERDRFIRGMFAWMGYRHTAVSFERPQRVAGDTKYGLGKMVRLALDGMIGFSDAPLRMVLWIGLATSVVAILYGLYALSLKLWRDHLVAGWTSTVVIIAFLCGMNMVMTGIVGLYVGRIHREVKGRPLYLVRSKYGFTEETLSPRTAARGKEMA